jgi:CBS domain-containing protein/mannitol/fructose-specific phosphotransferase system IIA component (Ntr-type)
MSPALIYLRDLLRLERVCLPLTASTLADATVRLVEVLAADGVLTDTDRVRERIEEARPEDIVGLADRAFVLHYRTDAVRDLAVAVGIAAKAFVRGLDEDEQQRARIVVLVLAPPRQMARHLQVVGAIAKALARPQAIAELLAAADASSVLAAPAWRSEVPTQLTVRDLMTETPRTVGPDAPLRSAVLDMLRAGVGGLPVVDEDNRVLGMLSERELLRDLLSHYLPRAGGAVATLPPTAGRRTVRDIMTRQVLCVSPEQPLAEVASLLLNKDVDRVPVVKEDRLVGFLTRGDIVRKLIGS